MGTYTRTDEEDKAATWCIQNDICITPRAIKWGERIWVIDIEKGKYPNRQKLGTSEPFGPNTICLLYTSPSPRDRQKSRMPSSA